MSSEAEREVGDSKYPVLAFHRLSPHFSFSSTNYSPKRFERLLDWQVASGVNLQSFTLTFDDGYAHLAQVLPPLMQRFRFKAIIFIPTAYMGKENDWDYTHYFRRERHLDTASIRGLASLGVRFGSHGHRHVDLTHLSDVRLRSELESSKRILEDALGSHIACISYPFGRCDQTVVQAAEKAGYEVGYTMRFPSSSDQPLAKGRIAIYGYDTRIAIANKLRNGPARHIERIKASITNRLSEGTIVLNRLRGLD
ncbi:MAG TPA: polysaccharide deacetylase family protein [Candidatus Acidoferrum sp.]|nr:polysaccharide deacetylase family protein [Candidatus Acidoferrum sp.]